MVMQHCIHCKRTTIATPIIRANGERWYRCSDCNKAYEEKYGINESNPETSLANAVNLSLRSEKEHVAYITGKYFTNEITLKMLKIMIESIPEQFSTDTTTSTGY